MKGIQQQRHTSTSTFDSAAQFDETPPRYISACVLLTSFPRDTHHAPPVYQRVHGGCCDTITVHSLHPMLSVRTRPLSGTARSDERLYNGLSYATETVLARIFRRSIPMTALKLLNTTFATFHEPMHFSCTTFGPIPCRNKEGYHFFAQ